METHHTNTQHDWIADVLTGKPPLLTVAEFADAVRTSPRNCKRWIASGRVRARRSVEAGSSRVLIPRTELERYLRSLDGEAESAPTRLAKATRRARA